jgi:hypothetical protein
LKSTYVAYQQFVNWVQQDMNKDREIVNRKVFSVVLWCLIFPVMLSLLVYGLRKYQILVGPVRYLDTFIFLPPFLYALYSLWPTLRDLPRVFRKGGLGAMLEGSAKEVEWREKTATRIQTEIQLTPKEWKIVSFHLEQEMIRLQDQNRYMTILSAVVLFFMFQFLDLGGAIETPLEASPAGMIKVWVAQFSQWGIQIFSLSLFSALFYLSGLQFQRYLQRYWVCIKRISEQGIWDKSET